MLIPTGIIFNTFQKEQAIPIKWLVSKAIPVFKNIGERTRLNATGPKPNCAQPQKYLKN